jgi:hypothetical protein
MMKRAKGVTLAEIVEATGWQKHTARGFVGILGSKGGAGASLPQLSIRSHQLSSAMRTL